MQLDEIQAGGGGPGGALARLGLSVLAAGWRASWALRRLAYHSGLKRRARLPPPVLSVGNLVAGGTGKTPFVAWLAETLASRGRRPGILSRGYGPRAAAGQLSDEGAVLEGLLDGRVPQIEDPDRRRGGTTLLREHPAVDVILLDDGFQHWPVARDLDIVLLDATRPFGHGHLLPRGLLREPKSALSRAGVVVLTRTERVQDTRALESEIARHTDAPIACVRTQPLSVEIAGARAACDALRGRRIAACCGIGNPGAFVAMLEQDLGAEVVYRRFLEDHADPDESTWEGILDEARDSGSDLVVITRKDAVKHAALPEDVAVLDVGLEFTRGESALLSAVDRALA